MLKILIGLLILSIMVFIHELGHFIAAKLCGVIVESFSIGWGPVLLKKKIGDTEYRISAIPMGGYCGMKGEKAFQQAMEEKLSAIPKEQGSMYAASPLRRIIIAFAGPFANFLSAIVALAFVSAIGSVHYTSSNKIAPVYCYDKTDNSPAKIADLQMGDRILSINGEKTETFAEIVRLIVPSATESVELKIERNGEILTKTLTPKLDPKTGAGIIGFYSFVPLDLEGVAKNSPAEKAGLKKDDIIIKVNSEPVFNTIDLSRALENIKEKTAMLTILRGAAQGSAQGAGEIETEIDLIKTENGFDLGIRPKVIKVETPGTGFFKSIANGALMTHKTLLLTIKSLTLLFKGVDLKEAVSGPLRITHLLGSVAEQGFAESIWIGLADILNFVSLISISLFIMNLLPIPILDGGLILFALIEIILSRQIHPKVLYYIQFIGFAFIGIVFIFALWGDIRFFVNG